MDSNFFCCASPGPFSSPSPRVAPLPPTPVSTLPFFAAADVAGSRSAEATPSPQRKHLVRRAKFALPHDPHTQSPCLRTGAPPAPRWCNFCCRYSPALNGEARELKGCARLSRSWMSSRTNRVVPNRGWSRMPVMAACACSAVSYCTIPTPLLFPVSLSSLTDAYTTSPQTLKWSFKSFHCAFSGSPLTNTRVPSPPFPPLSLCCVAWAANIR
mmetsp:Transcript_41974/g.82567  ORF Transcript_41974/g.82567 Transcript_41974/m.82567 type:complete len:213 (+) Transcript_41974:309-947(+)